MTFGINQILLCGACLAVGTVIGLAFGSIQDAAARKNLQRQGNGQLNSGWAVMPGSMRRTAYFLMILAGIQLVCPLMFSNGSQWWVSGGVAAGYGTTLYRQLRRRMAELR